jgi:hypothetical protein
MPIWGWIIIAAVVIGIVVGLFAAYWARKQQTEPSQERLGPPGEDEERVPDRT